MTKKKLGKLLQKVFIKIIKYIQGLPHVLLSVACIIRDSKFLYILNCLLYENYYHKVKMSKRFCSVCLIRLNC